MHTEYVSSQLLFVNIMKFVFDVFKESLFTWNHKHKLCTLWSLTPHAITSTGLDAASWRFRVNWTLLAAAKLRQCSRRFSSINLFTIFVDVYTIGPSGWFGWSIQGVLGDRLEEGPKGSAMDAESE